MSISRLPRIFPGASFAARASAAAAQEQPPPHPQRVDGVRFHVNLLPHPLGVTTLRELAPGKRVNLEVDLMARYAARLLEAGGGPRET